MTSAPNSTPSSVNRKAEPGMHRRPWWIWAIAGIVAVGVITGGVAVFAYAVQDRTIMRHATIAGQDVGGLSTLTALNRINDAWAAFMKRSLAFTAGDTTVTVPLSGTASNTDEVVIDLVSLDVQAAVNAAYDYTHEGSIMTRLKRRMSGLLGRPHAFGQPKIATETVIETLRGKLGPKETSARNARIAVDAKGTVTVVPSAPGQTWNYPQALKQAIEQIRRLDSSPMPIPSVVSPPGIPADPSLQGIAERAVPAILAQAPLTITGNGHEVKITKTKLGTLLGFKKTPAGIAVGFDQAALRAWIDGVKKDIEVQPEEARFTVVDGAVKEFSTSIVGQIIDVEKSMAAIETSIIDQHISTAAFAMQEVKPQSQGIAANSLGITELVGEATTNFRNSPTNRRFNLTYGAAKLNGLLIKPGETFSLVAALGSIDAAHGWKSELVIKGTDITPEFGGGLCQVGTTMFRVALNAGLPIVERRNHSLRISYYEPPIGLDATIYDPKPDFRFTNDYATPLLLQTEVSGTNLTFRLYGQKDGRSVDLPTPKVYNRKPIPPTVNVEVESIPPGQKACQAPGHPGADATATYTVTYADGHQNKQVFQSHYRPLPVICQVIKKKTAPPPKPATGTNTNTAPKTNTNASTNTNAVPVTNTNSAL